MGKWSTFKKWRKEEIISDIEFEYARFLRQIDPNIHDDVLIAATACIFFQKKGHICLDLNKPTNEPLFDEEKTGIRLNEDVLESWFRALEQSKLVSKDGTLQPLVLEEGRLYLHKYWSLEDELVKWVKSRANETHSISSEQKEVLSSLIKPKKDLFETNWQEVALSLSFMKDLIFISGGPGTGKTYTVLNIIAAHSVLKPQGDFKIALAAPTGKAARRLIESIEVGQQNLPDKLLDKVHLPDSAVTVHKLLGASYRANTFRYNEENHLPHDLVVVDEASMLDINMWVRLIRAIGHNTKLVVLGDKDQLASVEAGSILGDICSGNNTFSRSVASNIADFTGSMPEVAEDDKPLLNDCVVFLTRSYRFDDKSGIKQLSDAINQQNIESVFKLLEDENLEGISWISPDTDSMNKVLKEYGFDHYSDIREKPPEMRLKSSNTKKILCAIRKTSLGVESINQTIEIGIKRKNSLINSVEWYDGRLVMATKNDVALRIRNGEMGIYSDKEKKVQFEGDYNTSISPSRLPGYESAFAITIHKSQGSEFDNVAIVLPEVYSNVLSKEILYTAVTRARKNTLVIGNKDIIQQTIERSVNRQSGVKDKIWSY